MQEAVCPFQAKALTFYICKEKIDQMKLLTRLAFLLLFMAAVTNAQAGVSTFDDLSLVPESFYTGEDLSGFGSFGGFTSGDNYFVNYKTDYPGWEYWDGFAYSNTTDTTTPGAANQFSAITGGGVDGSANYAVAYTFGMSGQKAAAFYGDDDDPMAMNVDGLYATNTTWAYQSMVNGDGFAKAFGGDDGTDADWFKLTIHGLDVSGDYTGNSVDFFLADYRFENSAEDYIIEDWTWVDLSGLEEVYGLEFILSSSDDDGSGPYGMRTPAYFSMDNLTTTPVPVPGAVWLLAGGLVGLVGLRRGRAVK